MFSPFPFASQRLIWLVCSIPQYVALHDGPYHAILSTTSSMALRAQALNGFESMYPSRRIHLGTGHNNLSGMAQVSTTSTCIGLVTAREEPLRALFPSRSHMHPFTHGNIVTGSPEDINGSAIRARTLRVQFSLRDHQTSCTLGCLLRRHPRTRMVADIRPRLSMIFNLIGARDFDT